MIWLENTLKCFEYCRNFWNMLLCKRIRRGDFTSEKKGIKTILPLMSMIDRNFCSCCWIPSKLGTIPWLFIYTISSLLFSLPFSSVGASFENVSASSMIPLFIPFGIHVFWIIPSNILRDFYRLSHNSLFIASPLFWKPITLFIFDRRPLRVLYNPTEQLCSHNQRPG